MTGSIWKQAYELYARDVVSTLDYPDYDPHDEFRLGLHDGRSLVVEEESDGEGEPCGYTWTLYDAAGEEITTDGHVNPEQFTLDVRSLI